MVLIDDDAEEELVPLDFAEATRVASPVFREKGFQDDAIELVVE